MKAALETGAIEQLNRGTGSYHSQVIRHKGVHWFSNYLMLAAPRHSDHHLHPTKPYPALEIGPPDQVPTLPYSLPVMGFIALNPRRWRALMDPQVARWAGVAARPEATPGESQLIEAIRRASTGET